MCESDFSNSVIFLEQIRSLITVISTQIYGYRRVTKDVYIYIRLQPFVRIGEILNQQLHTKSDTNSIVTSFSARRLNFTMLKT